MKRIKHFISILLSVSMIMPFLITALPDNVYADSTTQKTLSDLEVDTGYANYGSQITATRTSDTISLTKAQRLKVSSSHYVDNVASYASASSSVTIQVFNTAGTLLTSKTLSGSHGSTNSEYVDLSNVFGEGYIKITATAPNCDSDNGTRVVFDAPVLYSEDIEIIEVNTGTVESFSDSTAWYDTKSLKSFTADLSAFAQWLDSMYNVGGGTLSHSYSFKGTSVATVIIQGMKSDGTIEDYKTYSVDGKSVAVKTTASQKFDYTFSSNDASIYSKVRLVASISTSSNDSLPPPYGGRDSYRCSEHSNGSIYARIIYSPNAEFTGDLASGNLT